MFEDQPRIGGKEPVRHGSPQQVGKFARHLVGWVGKNDPVRTFPIVWALEKVLNPAGANRHMICDPALLHISAKQFERRSVGFNAGDMGRPSAQRFNANGACSCIEIKEAAIPQPIPDDREECFAHPIGRWANR